MRVSFAVACLLGLVSTQDVFLQEVTDQPINEVKVGDEPSVTKDVLSTLRENLTQTDNDKYDPNLAQLSYQKYKKCTQSINRLHNVIKTNALWEKYKLGDGVKDKFFDPDFKDEQASLFWPDAPNKEIYNTFKRVQEWRRPSEIIVENGDT